jgi:hypothetical protein
MQSQISLAHRKHRGRHSLGSHLAAPSHPRSDSAIWTKVQTSATDLFSGKAQSVGNKLLNSASPGDKEIDVWQNTYPTLPSFQMHLEIGFYLTYFRILIKLGPLEATKTRHSGLAGTKMWEASQNLWLDWFLRFFSPTKPVWLEWKQQLSQPIQKINPETQRK